MSKIFCLFCISALQCATLFAQPANLALKDLIKEQELTVSEAPPAERSRTLLDLAKLYYQDQNQEKAFAVFFEAIQTADVLDAPSKAEDNAIYAEALKVYLDPHAQSTRDTASALLERYSPVVLEHPEYPQISFLVAASYANAGNFARFFDIFYHAYLKAPNHYMAFKTTAIIHIKIFERASSLEAKNVQREKILTALLKAAEIYPADHTLYKMTISFAPVEQKEGVVKNGLKKIIDNNIVIPRTDIGFYVEEAVKAQQYESAQQLLDKARDWYKYSRIINTAQEFLDQQSKRA